MRYALFKQKKKRVSGAKRRKSSRLRRFLLTIFLGCFALGVLSLGGVFWYFARDLPEAGALRAQAVAQSTKIYDRTGKHLLYEIHGEEKRTVIPFEQIPSVVKYATIALEDQAFYDHPGVNVKSIFRAALSQLFPGFFPRRSGGSTITQQLIKNTLLTPERTLKRKIREVILSLELERKFSKDEILEMYLNEIPYGSNAYGIESAAKTFFDKSAKDLTLDEAALLAALPQQPSRYSPYGKNTDKLIARKNYALTQMAKLGYITAEQAERAKKIDTLAKTAPKRDKIRAPHFVMYIRQQLESRYERGDIEKGGLKVITTLDWELQQLAEKAVAEGVEKNRRWRATNASLVAIDPKTGEILAMVGSADYFNREIDGNVNVALAPRQPGSSFKPYVYLGALIKGYSPETVLMDVPTRFDTGDDPYEPRNYDGTFRGPVKMKKALGMSLNIPAVKLLYLVGVKNTIALAKDLGITGLDNPDRYGLSLVLGGGEVKLLDHTAAYATLANGGVRQKPVSILRITDKEGDVLREHKLKEGRRVVDEKFVAALDHMLSENKFRAPAFGADNPLRFDTRPVAAKTGTTNEYRDAWTMGYTPSLAVGVWVGNSDNTAMKPGAAGGVVAAPIWRAFMEEALRDKPIEYFPDYTGVKILGRDENSSIDKADSVAGETSSDGVTPAEASSEEEPAFIVPDKWMINGLVEKTDKRIKVCRISKKKNLWCLASDACDKDKKKKRQFVNAHSILHYVDRDNPLSPDWPSNSEADPQYKLWEKGVRKFYRKKMEAGEKIVLGEAPREKCQESDFD